MATLGTGHSSAHIQMDMGNEKSSDLSTEQFLMYGYKVVQCSKRYRHDWSVCPFAHTGEMAARRDPSRYLPIFCFHSKQRLPCPRGEECMYSHNLFEYWLHPQRYRTEMCQFGANCTRPVCFFAHGEHQLRHTNMPGGPQPVVGPPEPIPGLSSSYNSRELGQVTDPAVKQQQQLLALHAAAAGFSSGSSQVRSDLLPVVEHGPSGYGGLMNGGGSMDMAALASQLNGGMGSFSTGNGMPASAPLSAPLPQLSPDLLVALQQLSGSGGGSGPPGGLMHQGSGIPASFGSSVPGRGGQAHGHAHASFPGAGPLLTATSNPVLVDELAKQLAVMQLMQAQGANNASAPLPQLSNVDEVLGQLAQMQRQGDGGLAGGGVSGGMSLEELLGTGCSTPMNLAPDTTSFSCPLPPVYSNSALADLLHGPPAASAALPRVPSPVGLGARHQQHFGSSNGLSGLGGGALSQPQSPMLSDTGRDAPSPGLPGGRDTAGDGGPGSTCKGRGGQPWSAPVSPATSTKGGSQSAAAGIDFKLSSISFTAGSSSAASSASSSVGRLISVASEGNMAGGERAVVGLAGNGMPSLSGGMGPGAVPLLLVGEHAMAAADVRQAICEAEEEQQPRLSSGNGNEVGGGRDQSSTGGKGKCGGMGEEMAVKLLAQLPQDSVKKLLDLVSKQGL